MKKIIFAGTPEFAATALKQLLKHCDAANCDEVVAVYTQPDRPAGRGRKLHPSAVKSVALAHDIPIEQPPNLKETKHLEQLKSYKADIMVVAAYGLLLPEPVLNAFAHGCINIHASLLPRWRGAAPIQRAIAAGDTETGITIMQMEKGLDTGPSILQKKIPITPDTTAATLERELAELGGSCLLEALRQIKANTLTLTAQDDSKSNYAHKLSKSDGLINWNEPVDTIHSKVRAYKPWPCAHSFFKNSGNETLKIWSCTPERNTTDASSTVGTVLPPINDCIRIKASDGVIAISELQLPGGKRLSAAAVLNAKHAWLTPGTVWQPNQLEPS